MRFFKRILDKLAKLVNAITLPLTTLRVWIWESEHDGIE